VADRETIVDAMSEAAPTGSDGFDQRFGIPSGTKQPWAVKQAWTNNAESMSMHSTGFVGPDWRYTVVVLTEYPVAKNWATPARAVTAGVAALEPVLR
jgi:hypothetical protein